MCRFSPSRLLFTCNICRNLTSEVITPQNNYAGQLIVAQTNGIPEAIPVLPIILHVTTIADYNILLLKLKDENVHKNVAVNFILLKLYFLLLEPLDKVDEDFNSQYSKAIMRTVMGRTFGCIWAVEFSAAKITIQ